MKNSQLTYGETYAYFGDRTLEDQTMVDAAKAGVVIALSTAASPEEARRIAAALVGEQLAACVNIVDNIHSIYRWQGAQPYLDWLLGSTGKFQKT